MSSETRLRPGPKPMKWPRFKCTYCHELLPKWAMGATICPKCLGESDDMEEEEDEQEAEAFTVDEYNEKDVEYQFVCATVKDGKCFNCNKYILLDSEYITVSSRWKAAAIFCDYRCLMMHAYDVKGFVEEEM